MLEDFDTSASKRILLIEGAAIVRNALCSALEACGHAVLALETGETGMRAVLQNKLDVVICNHQLPGMSGLDFFAKTQAVLSRAKTILTAAYAEDYLANDAHALGVDVFMEKPFSIENLLACMDRGHPETMEGKLGSHLYLTNGGQTISIAPPHLMNEVLSACCPTTVSVEKDIHRKGRQWKLYLNSVKLPCLPPSGATNVHHSQQINRKGVDV